MQKEFGVTQANAVAPGTQFLELDGLQNSEISTLVPVQQDQLYELSFYYSPRNNVGSGPLPAATNGMEVYWGSELVATLAREGSPSETQNLWTQHAYLLRAEEVVPDVGGITPAFVDLRFRAAGESDGLGALLDKVVVRFVPEPSGIALLLLGMLLSPSPVGRTLR
jgi:hypothetical protein